MSDLQTSFDEIKEHFPEVAGEILAAFETKFARAKMPASAVKDLKWFYAFEAERDLAGRDTKEINVAIYATHGRKRHQVDHWRQHGPLKPSALPPSLAAMMAIEEDGIQRHNTPHEAIITWRHPDSDKASEYLVCAGVQMPNDTLRVALGPIGAPAFMRRPNEIERSLIWVRISEDEIASLNDIGSSLAGRILTSKPGSFPWRGETMRCLEPEELRVFAGAVYDGHARLQDAPRP